MVNILPFLGHLYAGRFLKPYGWEIYLSYTLEKKNNGGGGRWMEENTTGKEEGGGDFFN